MNQAPMMPEAPYDQLGQAAREMLGRRRTHREAFSPPKERLWMEVVTVDPSTRHPGVHRC
ncbi:hypothetical protein QFZ69_004727 [Arthrobacter sp. V1I7]|nr:hypothetical protein [Arthrobacter sp. V1I7]